eukprot:g32371.t1
MQFGCRDQRKRLSLRRALSSTSMPQQGKAAGLTRDSPLSLISGSDMGSSLNVCLPSVCRDLKSLRVFVAPLCRFLRLGLPDESSEGEVSSHADGRDLPSLPQSFGENLGELLGSLTLPLRHVERLEVPKAAGPVVRPNLSAGDETVRTEMSYLTARSTVTEDS